MQITYVVYATLGVVGIVTNILGIFFRRRRMKTSLLQGISEEHGVCLEVANVLLALTSFIILLGSFQDVFPDDVTLCNIAGFSALYILLADSWAPLMTVIILLEKEYHSLRIKSYQGMTPKIVLFIIAAILIISGGLVAINYAPITEFSSERHLLCVPITFPYQLGFEYTKLLVILIWCGVASTWSCTFAWFLTLCKNRKCVRYVTECHRSTKAAGAEVAAGYFLWTIIILLTSVYYWKPAEDFLHTAVVFTLLYVIGYPSFSLISYWLAGSPSELNPSLNRNMPSRLTDITPLTVNPDKDITKFHSRWLGRFNEKIEAIIKVYNPAQRSKWLKEVRAMEILRKTEHPNIAKYLWASRGRSVAFPTTNLTQEYTNMLTDTSNRLVSMQYYKHRSLREMMLHMPSVVTDSTLKHIALDVISALVHLRQLHIVHNKLNSKTVFIKSTPKSKTVTAVVGCFEESEQVTLDHHRDEKNVRSQSHPRVAVQLDIKFAADIRSYALLLLELVSVWNRHNGQPMKDVKSKVKPKADTVSLQSEERSSVCTSPEILPAERQQERGRRTRTRQTTKSRNLSQKPQFSEIEEEHQSNLQQQRIVNGEEVAIEMEDIAEHELMYSGKGSYVTEVIIPNGMTESNFTYNNIQYHPVTGRQSSGSACSVDSGYPKSVMSSAVSHISELPSLSACSDYTPCVSEFPLNDINKANLQPDEGRLSGIYIVGRATCNLSSITYDKVGGKGGFSPRDLESYFKAKQTLPKDILEDCEEYQLDDDFDLSEEERIYESIPTLEAEQAQCHINKESSETNDLNLSELAERVTQDVTEFLKLKSQTNSMCSSPAPSSLKSRPSSRISCYSNKTFLSDTSQSLHTKFNETSYLDKNVLTERSHGSNGRFIHRAGISTTQLYYSKELFSMYENITPRLLFANERTTKRLFHQYSTKLRVPTIKKLMAMSGQCWLQDPVWPAEAVMSQLRKDFTLTSTTAQVIA